jgi:serine/threonine protein kinase
MSFLKTTINGNCPIEIPQTVGCYEFVRLISESTYALICLVVAPNTKSHYACKVVPRAVLAHEHVFECFERELRILQTVHHSNIVELIDVVYTDDLIYVVMEYCQGGDLLSMIHDCEYLDELRCRSIIRDVLLGIEGLHRRNISHRDIKPENILIDETGHAKIADFGLSNHMNTNGLLNTACGTIGYVAPEIVQGGPYNGRKADIWSCGILLFVMATGKMPWTSRNTPDILEQALDGDFRVPSSVGISITRMIEKMLIVDPAERPDIEELISNPWLGVSTRKTSRTLPTSSSGGLLALRRNSLTPSKIVLVRPHLTIPSLSQFQPSFGRVP